MIINTLITIMSICRDIRLENTYHSHAEVMIIELCKQNYMVYADIGPCIFLQEESNMPKAMSAPPRPPKYTAK